MVVRAHLQIDVYPLLFQKPLPKIHLTTATETDTDPLDLLYVTRFSVVFLVLLLYVVVPWTPLDIAYGQAWERSRSDPVEPV